MSFFYKHFFSHNTPIPLIYTFPLCISSNGYSENANYGLNDSNDSPTTEYWFLPGTSRHHEEPNYTQEV